jgi:hypothetical protein
VRSGGLARLAGGAAGGRSRDSGFVLGVAGLFALGFALGFAVGLGLAALAIGSAAGFRSLVAAALAGFGSTAGFFSRGCVVMSSFTGTAGTAVRERTAGSKKGSNEGQKKELFHKMILLVNEFVLTSL